VIDGAEGWLIPALAEMHAHVPPRSQGEQRVDDVLALFLAGGVTTIRGMLGEPWHLELREELADGRRIGPRLITSGPSFNGNTVTAPAQGAARAREQAAAGYDFLKIHPGLSRDEFLAIAKAAQDAGLPVAGHVSFETGLETALRWRQASIDHLDAYAEALVPPTSDLFETPPEFFGINLAAAMDPSGIDDLARQTAEAGVWNVPTQSLFEGTLGPASLEELRQRPGMDLLSAETLERWERSVQELRERITEEDRRHFLAIRRALIGALQDAGAGLLLGSDAPQIMNVPGYSVHQELQHLVASGLTPLEALQTGTVNVARFFGEDDRGRIAPGQVADFVLLGANPLEDIGNTAAILGVAREGRWLDRSTLDRLIEGVRSRGL
jgi:imidazolonepropionase-like amidohydrolase